MVLAAGLTTMYVPFSDEPPGEHIRHYALVLRNYDAVPLRPTVVDRFVGWCRAVGSVSIPKVATGLWSRAGLRPMRTCTRTLVVGGVLVCSVGACGTGT